MSKFFKFSVIIVFVVILGLVAQNANATLINNISIPSSGVNFNHLTRDFTISGFSSNVKVNYADLTHINYYASFVLSTVGMSSVISNIGKTITYTETNVAGIVDLEDYFSPNSKLITGSLESLEMTVIDPALGLFKGLGIFSVTGGTLSSQFGSNGGFATVGISFNMPQDFFSSFAGIANTNLYPEDPIPSPEPTTILLFGCGLLGLVGYSRKRFSKKS